MKCKTLLNRTLALSTILASVASLANPSLVMADGYEFFVDSGQSLGSSSSKHVALGDVDGDGDLDAFVGNEGPNTVFLNDGAGAYADSGQSMGNSNSLGVALVDLDDDGDLDAFVGNWDADDEVWLNDGAGIFSDSGQRLGGSQSHDVALGDLDDDGDQDAFAANAGGANKIWLNDGMGTFSDSGQSLGSSSSPGVDLGDVDGDGDLDIFVANCCGQANKVWLNDGTGTFTDSGQSLGSSDSPNVALGDLDDDGDLDAFITNHNQANKVWLNDGTGTFTDSGQSLGSGYTPCVVLGDVDGDGDLDAFIGNNAGQANKVWLNSGEGTFTDGGQSLGSSDSQGLALGDVDNDGDLDAFAANEAFVSDRANKVWLNASINVVTTPDNTETYPGDTINVTLDIHDAQSLYAAQATCMVNPTILESQSGVFGDFFDPVNRLVGANTVDPVADTWTGAISQRSPAGPLSGDGLFATLTYQALSPGTTSITCEVLLSDRDGFVLPFSFVGAEVTVLPFASVDGVATYQGRLDHAGIEVTATGTVTRTDTTDGNGNFTLYELRAGSYDIVADAPGYLPVCTTQALNPGAEITLAATTLAGGDVNDDDVINIGDATLIGNNFGLDVPPGDAAADINADDVINVQDLAILGGNYEMSGCQSW